MNEPHTFSDDSEARLLLAAANEFLAPLRLGHGLDRAKFQALCSAIRGLHERYRTSSVLPKPIVSVLVYLVPAIASCESLYRGEEHDGLIAAGIELLEVIVDGLDDAPEGGW